MARSVISQRKAYAVRAHAGGDEELRVAQAELVARVEFTEWTLDGHLRHSKFCGLREDKDPGEVVREE